VSVPAGAAFLSWASEDSEAARLIAESLKAAGIGVWFDLSELRDGNARDHRSANTSAIAAFSSPSSQARCSRASRGLPSRVMTADWRMGHEETQA
jgi:hypothetical protein